MIAFLGSYGRRMMEFLQSDKSMRLIKIFSSQDLLTACEGFFYTMYLRRTFLSHKFYNKSMKSIETFDF